MGKIINGKRYDKDTAEKLLYYDNGYPSNNFSSIYEALYRKRTGEFFLYCEGGPYTVYGARHGDNIGFGCQYIPLTEEDARQWVEDKCTSEEYESVFGKVSEDDSEVAFHFFMKSSLMSKLSEEALLLGISKKDIIEAALIEHFSK